MVASQLARGVLQLLVENSSLGQSMQSNEWIMMVLLDIEGV